MLHRNQRTLAVLIALSGLTSCRVAVDRLAGDPLQARYQADHALAGFAFRFFNVQRDSQFHVARTLMGQYALIPSRLYRDSTLWNSGHDSTRTLLVRGEFLDTAYRFAADPRAPYPTTLSDQRAGMSLRWLGGGDYHWDLAVHHAVGPVAPAAVASAITAALTAAEGRHGEAVLSDARTAFARTSAAMDPLLDLDSLRTERGPDGTRVTLGVTFQPTQLRARFPHFAAFVERYIMPTVYAASLTDASGRPYVDLTGRDGRLVIRLKSRDQALVALDGPPVAMPDTLVLRAELSMKYGIFRVGFTDLVGAFVIERSPHVRAWHMRFTREPAWHFPLAVDRLIRNPLRRPFRDRGIEFTLGVRDDLGPQTQSVRLTRITVNESAIMRWIGRLGATAFGEFTGATEVEENRFLYDVFAALREDIRTW